MARVIDFTNRAVEAAEVPAAGRAEFKDSKVPGLYLRVTSTGVRTFSFVGRAKGSSRVERVTIGKYPAVKADEARRRAQMLVGELASGTSPADVVRAKRQEMTLGDVADLYFASLVRRGAKSSAGKDAWERHGAPTLGKRKLSEITAAQLERWHRALPSQIQERRAAELEERQRREAERRAEIAARQAVRRRGPDPKPKEPATARRAVTGERTANLALETVRTIYRWASSPQRLYFTGVNPATGHKLFAENERERFLQPDELGPFFQALAAEPNAAMRDFILLALLTGARRSNVAAMRWADVDLPRAQWTIAGQLIKNGRPQTVTLTPEAVEILKARAEGTKSPFVFPSAKAKSGHIEDPRRTWERVLHASGIADLRLHDLRRTLGSWLARTGASLLLIGKTLNHKDQASTAIYARLDLDPVRQSVTRATSAMFEAAGLKGSAQVVPMSAEPAKAKRRPKAA